MMLTMTPACRCFIPARYSLVRWIYPITFSAQASSQRSIERSSRPPPGMAPALLTRMSMSGKAAATRSRSAPCDRPAAQADSRSASRATSTTEHPSFRNTRAQASPIPFEPPVISTRRPLSFRSMMGFPQAASGAQRLGLHVPVADLAAGHEDDLAAGMQHLDHLDEFVETVRHGDQMRV